MEKIQRLLTGLEYYFNHLNRTGCQVLYPFQPDLKHIFDQTLKSAPSRSSAPRRVPLAANRSLFKSIPEANDPLPFIF
jgi:hypothetical protein